MKTREEMRQRWNELVPLARQLDIILVSPPLEVRRRWRQRWWLAIPRRSIFRTRALGRVLVEQLTEDIAKRSNVR